MARAILDTLYQRAVGDGLLPFYETVLRGRKTFRYHQEFELNQWLTAEELRDLQWAKLQALLRHAYATTAYYKRILDEMGARPDDFRDLRDFARIPVLEKSDVREHRAELISSSFRPEQLHRSATSGSTGEPFQYFYNRDSYERRMAAAMRGDRWANWRLCAPELYIWGTRLVPESRWKRLKVQAHFASLRRTDITCYALPSGDLREAVERWNRHRPQTVCGYANAIYEFARSVEQAGLEVRPAKGVILTAERVFPHQKELISRVLGPAFERYGCREVMMVGAECEHRCGMHATIDNLVVEIERDGRPCEPGELGEFLLTDLHNYAMPLIRYKVGDGGMWHGKDCPCGRGLPLLKGVEGRILDMLTTPEGRVISGVFFPHLLMGFRAIRSFDVVQESRTRLVVRMALAETLAPEDWRFIQSKVTETFGEAMHVEWIVGPDVQIERSAKYRPVRSNVKIEWNEPVATGG